MCDCKRFPKKTRQNLLKQITCKNYKGSNSVQVTSQTEIIDISNRIENLLNKYVSKYQVSFENMGLYIKCIFSI